MSKWKFEPVDFGTEYGDLSMFDASNIANAKLKEWLTEAQTVYANLNFPPDMNPVWGVPQDADTHRAKLIMIEELPKEECEHEPAFVNKIPGWHHGPTSEVACRRCGIKMLAKWEAVK